MNKKTVSLTTVLMIASMLSLTGCTTTETTDPVIPDTNTGSSTTTPDQNSTETPDTNTENPDDSNTNNGDVSNINVGDTYEVVLENPTDWIAGFEGDSIEIIPNADGIYNTIRGLKKQNNVEVRFKSMTTGEEKIFIYNIVD